MNGCWTKVLVGTTRPVWSAKLKPIKRKEVALSGDASLFPSRNYIRASRLPLHNHFILPTRDTAQHPLYENSNYYRFAHTLETCCTRIMDEPADTIAVCETKKRPFPDNEPHVSIPLSGEAVQSVETSTSMPTPPLTAESDNGSPAQSKDALRQASPALSTSTLSSLATSTQEPRDGASGTLAKASSSTPRPAKRRKLTVVEKEQQLREKEAKEREKAEKKAKREEEKTKKEEEKRVKDEERRRKNEEREVKQREKDLEKQRKEEERAKKERVSMSKA